MGVQRQQRSKQQKKLQQASQPAQHPTSPAPQTSPAVTFSTQDFKSLFSRLEPSLQWLKKYGPKYGFLFLILIPLLVSTWIRMQPENLESMNELAKKQVDEKIRQFFTQELIKKYPESNPRELQRIIEQATEKKKKELGTQYLQQVEKEKVKLKAYFQNDQNEMYLLSIDSYQYLRYTENVLERGHHGDEIRDGQWFDTHMRAPLGKPLNFSLYPYFNAYLYRFLSIFSDITVERVVAISQVILIALTLIVMYLLLQRFVGNFGALTGTLLFAIHPALMDRTVGGLADTDAFIMLFFFLIIWFFVLAFDATGKKKWMYLILTGTATGIFTHLWTGWWLTMYLLVGSGIVYTFLIIFFKRTAVIGTIKQQTTYKEKFKAIWTQKEVKNAWTTTGLFFIITVILISVFRGRRFMEYLEILFFMPFYYIGNINTASIKSGSLWPNVYTTVSELVQVSNKDVIKQLGGIKFIIVVLMGLGLLLWYGLQKYEESHENKKRPIGYTISYTAVLLGVITLLWGVGMEYTALQGGSRFVSMMVPPLALGFGIAAGLLLRWILEQTKKLVAENSVAHLPVKIVCAVLFILMIGWMMGFTITDPCTGICKTSKNMAVYYLPMMDDGWYETLTKIKQESSPDAIINSWWDFGHWFKVYADRAVTFDGASQNTPQAYWIGRALITDNEKETLAILRMLNCGAQTGFEFIQNATATQEQFEAMRITNKILGKTKDQATQILQQQGFDEQTIQKIMERMFCTPPESYVITSGDMLDKSIVWGHFGLWDFEKAWILNNAKELPQEEAIRFMKEKAGYPQEKAEQTYQELEKLKSDNQKKLWITHLPVYTNQGFCKPTKEKERIICSITGYGKEEIFFDVDLGKKDVYAVYEYKGRNERYVERPKSLLWSDGSELHEKVFPESKMTGSLILMEREGMYSVDLVEYPYRKSIFNRLFLLGGTDLKHFTLFHEQRSISEGAIQVWKVDWKGKQS